MKKRILAMFMAMAMAFSLLPTSVLAAPGDNRPGSSEEAESLPIHYFIAEPGQAANPNGDYLNYKEELWGAKGGTYATPAADSNTQIASQNGIRNVNYEEEVTQFIQTWPEGYTEETFKKFGSLRINGVTYTEENYDLVWVTICKRGSSNLRCYCGVNYEHIHIDGVLTKKIEPAELKLTKTIPAAQSQDETFTFTLRELAQTENYVPVEPMTYVKDSEVTMTATIPAGQKSAAIQSSVEGTEIGFGYYELVESSSDKWQSAPVYILIATDGSLKYSSTYNGRYTQSNVGITVSNQYKTYTVTYTDGLENVNAFNDQKYTGLVYGTNTPSFQGGTPVYPGGTMVFDGWDSEVAETVTGNVTYTAQWKDNAYTVTWLNEDGKTVLEKDIDVTNGTRPEYNGDTPKKAADNQYTYTFAGWSPAITPVNGADQVYIAVYTPVLNTYTVKWYDADHTLLEIDENVPYNTFPTYDNANDKGTTAQLAAAKNTAQYTYRFAGWSPVPAAVTGDQEYVATYTQTTNQYTVTWLNYNDSQLGQDHKDYGAVPAYLIEGDAARGQYPTRPDTANYTYVFNGWWCDKDGDRMEDEGEVYGKDAPLPAVTGDVTYKARFTPVMKTFDVTLKLFLDENPVDDSVIHDQEEVPVLKTDASSEEFSCVEPEGTTGTYLFKNVPNGTYRIYHQGGTKPVCSQIIVVENGDVTKECHYYSVIYDGNGADSGSVPADAHHHLGTSVTVGNAPTREGYTFDGWWYDADNDNTVDKGEIYQPNASLTNSITKPYRLAAQWVEKVDVKINVTIDHTYGDNWDDSSSKDNVIVELISKPKSGTDSWLEVDDGELNLSADGYGEEKFAYQITPDDADEKNVTKTEYQAKKATFANMRGDLDYNVTVTKAGYEVKSISATQDSVTHDWTIDVVLKYAPDDAELNFSVAMDEGVPEEAYPDAVIAKVIYWDSTSNSWEFIQEHAGNNPGIRVNIDDVTGEGSGSHTVWTVDHNKNDEPYGYRFIIDSFVYDGKIVPATPDSAAESYTDNLFTGMMQDIETNEKYGGFKYAYFENENDTQLGTLRAVITMELFDVIFHGNGGTTEGEAMLTLADQYQVPDLTKYTPVHEKQGHVFEGWFEDEALTDPAESNERLTADKHLYAKWKHPLTVLGDIHVDATYTLDGETKTINEADRITSVTVLLQHAAEGSDHFINVDSRSVSITYSGENPSGTGDYEFINLENTGTWRIQVLGRNYNVLYKNENVTEYGTSSFNAVDNNNDDVARVDVKMNFEPATFDLSYLVDASAIGEGFKPANAEVMVLYDDKPSESDSPRDWPVISQMQDGFRGFTGQTSEVDKVDTYSVWKYHPQGYLYDYAIRVEAVDTVDLTGNEPYTVEYNGSAEYKEADTSATTERYEQTQLLIAKLVPKTYPIKYYMEKPGGINSTIELMGMTVTSHTWSHATYLKDADGNWKDVPTRAGYVFTGWVNERGESVTEIAANVQAETKLYATWTLDSWADAEANENDNITEDALTGGDGIPDSEQVHVRYEAEANGTTTPVGEIYTIPGEDFTDVEVTVTSGSTAAPASGYAVDLWSYVANESDANDTATLNRNGASIKPVINNADGGKTYTFKVSFAKDDWKDDPNGPDSPTGGDGTPDKYQAMVEFHTVNYQQGTVSGNIYQVTTFANGASSGTVTPTLDGVIVDPEDGWAFDYWTLGSDSSDKLTEANVTTSRTVDAGSTTIFYAHFAKDDWKDADETTDPNDKDTPAGGDGIPDYKQALVKFSAAANGRGTVTGDGAVQIFTLPANNAGQYVGNITPVNTAEVSVIVTPNTGYAFDYWGDPDNFWDEGYGAAVDPFRIHEGVKGGQIIGYVAHFDTDTWNDKDDDPNKGDGTPDKYQKLVNFYVENGYWNEGENDNTQKTIVVTLTKDGKNAEDGTYTLTAEEIPAVGNNPAEGYTAGSWDTEPLGAEVNKTDLANFTYTYEVDKIGEGEDNDTDKPDGIPDKYQVTLEFQADPTEGGTVTPAKRVITLKDADGKYIKSGTVTVEAAAEAGKHEEENNSYSYAFVNWTYQDAVLTDEEELEEEGFAVNGGRTYTFVAHFNVPQVPYEPVAVYKTEYYFENASGEYVINDDLTAQNSAEIGKTETAVKLDPVPAGYVFDAVVTGTQDTAVVQMPEPIINDAGETTGVELTTLKVYYSIDNWNDEKDVIDEGDGIPDKYQVAVVFKSADENKGTVTGDGIVQVFTLPENAESGTVDPVMTDVTATAKSGYRFSFWTRDAGTAAVNPDTPIENVAGGTVIEFYAHWAKKNKPVNPPVNPPALNTEDHYAYIIGYPDGNVKPDGSITRAEVATIFFRLLTDESRTECWATTNDYSDVSANQWYNNAISTLSNADILDGYDDGTFRPNAPITRAEFAKIAVSFFSFADEEYKALYPDVPEGKWYAKYVEAASELGLITGYPDGTFRPEQNITRAEACTIVNRTIDRHPHEDQLHEDMIVWPDNPAPGEAGHQWYYEQVQEATNSHEYVMENSFEDWTDLLENRDWAAFEKMWSDANSAPGGDVMK